MNILDRDFVRAINSGHCFALVGSGPSCDVGMPSWRDLANRVASQLTDPADIQQAKEIIISKQYSKFFGLAERILGKQPLLTAIQKELSGDWPVGQVYEYIVSWPFQSYLTTNFDDQLLRHLKQKESDAVKRLNSKADMQILHNTTTNVVFKVHGDFSVPADIVLTESQYSNFQQGADRQYWRDTIFAFLRMVDLIIMGYSASDPDFNEQLERAKQIASPDHPVYMFASDIDQPMIDEYFIKKNIHVISYSNRLGNHDGLKRVLSRYHPFIARRGSSNVGLMPPDPNSVLASSLHLFANTRLSDPSGTCIARSCAALLLQVLSAFPRDQPIKLVQLLDTFKTKIFATAGVDPEAIQSGLQHLHSRGLIETPSPDEFTIHPNGIALLTNVAAKRALIEEQFDSTCRAFLTTVYPNLTGSEKDVLIKHMKDGLITAFERRGIEIARSVFSDIWMDVSDATDIIETINLRGGDLPTLEERAAFADLMVEVLLKGNRATKEYLGALSQGYFAYHALALDQNCSEERLNLAKAKTWILDSSVILAFLAIDSLNHDYARDLLRRMKDLGLRFTTTEKLLLEVRDHAYWAIVNFAHEPADSLKLLLAAEVGPGYKQNLFLDGFTKWSVTQGNPRIGNYFTECLGADYSKELREAIKKQIQNLGIDVQEFSAWPNFKEPLYAERGSLSEKIADSRRSNNTYTGSDQCDAEAEIVLITQLVEARFLSQSKFLNNYSVNSIVWKPETMFRFLTLFSSVPASNEVLHQCMTQDFFSAGFDIVDQQTIGNYASPLVHQARMKLNNERRNYEQVLGKERVAELEADFERTPDSQKPFYSMQFAYYVASQAETKLKTELQRGAVRVAVAEATSELNQKERRQFERLRAKQNEKHAQQQKTKRRQQSKRHKKSK